MNKDKFTEQELEEARERNKNGRKFKNDTVWESNEYGSFTVIGRFDKSKLYIQFNNTGAIYVRRSTAIATGQVKDYYAPNVYNVGFIGEGEYNSVSHKTIYKRWKAMLDRIYGDNHHTYNDCSISEEWLNFQNFARDLEELMREKGIDSLEGYAIDKDIKVKGNRAYSKETISIVTQAENNEEMINRINNTVYIAENLSTGEKVEFTNQSQFGREHGFNSVNISNILAGRRKTVKGWTFYKKGDKAPVFNDVIYIAENLVSGEVIEFTNQSQFARDYNLDRRRISAVINGKQNKTGDWTFYRKEKQVIYKSKEEI